MWLYKFEESKKHRGEIKFAYSEHTIIIDFHYEIRQGQNAHKIKDSTLNDPHVCATVLFKMRYTTWSILIS
jgi:hypothetical protein